MPLGVGVPFLWQMSDFLRMHGNASCIGGGYQICDKCRTSWECMAMHHALGVGTRFVTNLRLPENAWKCIMHWGWASHICDISKMYDFLRMHGNASCIGGVPPISYVTSQFYDFLRMHGNASCIGGGPPIFVTSQFLDFLRMHGNASCIGGGPPIFVTSQFLDFLRMHGNASCIGGGPPISYVTRQKFSSWAK